MTDRSVIVEKCGEVDNRMFVLRGNYDTATSSRLYDCNLSLIDAHQDRHYIYRRWDSKNFKMFLYAPKRALYDYDACILRSVPLKSFMSFIYTPRLYTR